MFVEEDIGTEDLVCLQCSYRKTVRSALNTYAEQQKRYAHWQEDQEADEKEPALTK